MSNNVIVPDEWPKHKKIKFLRTALIVVVLILVILI
jgi:hypothetical protein